MSRIPFEADVSTTATDSGWLCPSAGTECRFQQELVSLRQQIIRDALTGLFNHRHLMESLEREIDRTERSELPTCLLMIDLDYFKQVNDRWGHEVGNLVLQASARVILETTRKLDIQCRYGGEEFAVILPSTHRLAAQNVAERIRQNIEALVFEQQGETFGVTASIGLACFESGQPAIASELLQQADKELYRAKQQGRNQVCSAPEVLSESHVTADEKALMMSLFGGADSDDDFDDSKPIG
ncbi:GGDEF domain-containing protein [Oceanobacter mangrovi]|uniref:GGDEF domain-containing protein n=1 Tax=Oceanobacter mangrovi TaxID=2862510 RepID=UPI001C8E282F|nr:GGDEF domain-containing protein [Oceanobacter mangrovi]